MENTLVLKWNVVVQRLQLYNGSVHESSQPHLQLPTPGDFPSLSEYLDHLAIISLDPTYSSAILYTFNELYLDIIARLVTITSLEQSFKKQKSIDSSFKDGIFVLYSLAKNISIFNPSSSSSTNALVGEFLSAHNFLIDQSFHEDQAELNLILVSFYRLLNHSNSFSQFISLKSLDTIIKGSGSSVINRYMAILILVKVMSYSTQKRSELIDQYIHDKSFLKGQFEMYQDFDYLFLALYEAKRKSNFLSFQKSSQAISSSASDINDIVVKQSDLSSSIKLVYGVLIPSLGSSTEPKVSESSFNKFVSIESSITTLVKLTNKLLVGQPIILYGASGSGKSLLLNHLHSLIKSNDNELVTLHLNDQTDIKLLLGTYVSSHEPGKFIWKDGVLTSAVKNGKWLVIEDIDNAKNEILSIFIGLIESNALIINGNEKIPIKNGFQIIGTISMDDNDKLLKSVNDSLKGENLAELDQFRFWQQYLFENAVDNKNENDLKNTNGLPDLISLNKFDTVSHSAPTPNELLSILATKYPELARNLPNNILWQKLISLFYYMKFRIFSRKSFVAMNNGLSLKKIDNFELIRLASRIDLLFKHNNNLHTDFDDLLEKIFFEAIDIFTSGLQNDKIKNFLINKIGLFLEVPSSKINFYANADSNKYAPELKIFQNEIMIGRNKLLIEEINEKYASEMEDKKVLTNFALTNHSLQLLEKISISVNLFEPVLLLGETGCGKTTIVQNLAKLFNKKLVVLNLSQETESNDLIGGYKPILNKQKSLIIPVHNKFLELFSQTFNLLKNDKFLKILNKEFKNESFGNVIKLWRKAVTMAYDYIKKQKEKMSSFYDDTNDNDNVKAKKKRKLNDKLSLLTDWQSFEQDILQFQVQYQKASQAVNSLQFDFVDGSLVKAIKNGDWVLLDEVNLASPETLENISDLLSNDPLHRKLLLTEKASEENDNEVVIANKEFRLFACMNPSTDVGKKNLPDNIRSKFNEIFVDSPDKNRNDLRTIVHKYLWRHLSDDDFTNNEIIDDIVQLYYEIKDLNDKNFLVDGSKNKIVVNIRILSRALVFTSDIVRTYGIRRSLYESFNMILLTLLDLSSQDLLQPIIYKYTIGKTKNVKAIINRIPPRPAHLPEASAIKFGHYWLEKGPYDVVEQPHYIITPFVEKNLLNLVRATLTKRFPILIQGPTSSGKTSMITYLSKITGNKVIRINNHEHTDLAEYLGSYVSDTKTGKLVFKHGPLIEALKHGYWIILDELNLASSEVLEGINRLLDDNREIFLTETQELIKPHKNFLLFATQNPPGVVYGGRKFLSKAFKNRFLELNFDDIPQDELEIILCNRCQIPPSYAKKIVAVYKELNVQRSSNRLFETKNSFATLRDLFRWGSREAVGYEQLATNGYMLLAEKNRKDEEKHIIKNAIEKVMRVKLDISEIYKSKFDAFGEKLIETNESKENVVWTGEMKKLSVLILEALVNNENVLLVGETGCGKTTVCDNLARNYFKQNMVFLNAHQNIETSDIIGSQRPLRNRSRLQEALKAKITEEFIKHKISYDGDYDLNDIVEVYENQKDVFPSEIVAEIDNLQKNLKVLFEWSDGPLINAMKSGDIFLFDEISLAEDSVLERLNSVLEPEKTLYLTEYSNEIDQNLIVASKGFQFLATMNPGGDYGKKELSPALRNRFTEIYVPSMSDFNDVGLIVNSKLDDEVKFVSEMIIKFSEWFSIRFSTNNSSTNNGVISIRDILAWVNFINNVHEQVGIEAALLHGVCMVFVDALGTNNTAYLASDPQRLADVKTLCIETLSQFASMKLLDIYHQEASVSLLEDQLVIGFFKIPRRVADDLSTGKLAFNLQAPTTAVNAMRVLRAMIIKKPILLEGDPGVGKSSLIDALAKATNNKLTRINLSDQTDLVDLFGSDAPVEGGNFGEFVWKDAPFLRAMKQGEWVLLDEMNLASPSLLEALNSVFDFRQKVYIPELDQEFTCHKNFRVFAAQNPQYQGGGRKGLPKSFINRFTNVYIGKLNHIDMELICKHIFPEISESTISKLIRLIGELESEINIKKRWGLQGGPWEFNIRDIIKFLDINGPNALNLVFAQKFRSSKDRENVYNLYYKIFGSLPTQGSYYHNDDTMVQANSSVVTKEQHTVFANENSLIPLQSNNELLESLFTAVQKSFPVLLAGPTLGGKSELIRFAANLIGARLETVHIHNEIDIADLVGGLDQYHLNKELLPILQDLEIYLGVLSSKLADSATISSIYRFLDYLVSFKHTLSLKPNADTSNEQKLTELIDNFEPLLKIVNNENLNDFLVHLNKIKAKKGKQFQFFDGILIDALEKGYWLHLSNINLVNSSIVDRLNSLTEHNGVLVVSESSSIDGEPKIIKPHPNFRLFLSMNPKYGELSRAMRNRCAEIYVESFANRATELDKLFLGLIDLQSLGDIAEPNIETQISNLTVGEISGNTKEFYSTFNVSSKEPMMKYLSLVVDILSQDLHDLDIKSRIAYAVASFIPINLFNEIQALQRFVDTVEICSSNDKFILERLIKFIKFLRDYGVAEKIISSYQEMTPIVSQKLACINSLTVSDNDINHIITFNFVQSLYDFFEFVEKFQQYTVIADLESERYALINDIYTSLKAIFILGFAGEEANKLISDIAIYGKLAVKVKEPEKFNFIIEQIKECLAKVSLVAPELRIEDANIEAISTFNIANSGSMTKLWNHFIILPAAIERLLGALPPAWKSFITVEYQNGWISGTSLDLQKFKESQKLATNSKKNYWIDEFAELFKLIEAANTSQSNFHIDDRFLMLALQSGKSTISLSNRYIGKLVKPYPFILESMFADNTLGSDPVLKDVFQKASDLNDVPGSEIKQAINDVKYLSTEIIANSSVIISNQLVYYQKILASWLKEVLVSQVSKDELLVAEIEAAWLDNNKLESVLSNIKANKQYTHFYSTIEKFFVPAILAVFSKNVSYEKLGKAFIFFSSGLIHLFMPSSPYDPAICEFILFDFFTIKKKSMEHSKSAIQIVRRILVGDKSIYFETTTGEPIEEPAKPRVQRPQEGSIQNLFEEWSAFMDSSVGQTAVEKLLTSLQSESNREILENKISMLHRSTERFLFNLSENFVSYTDLNSIFKGGILGLNFGLSLVLMQDKQNRCQAEDALSSLINFESFFQNSKDTLAVLKSFAFYYKDEIHTDSHLEHVNKILLEAFKRWKINITKKETEQREAENMYKFSGQEEDDFEDAYKTLFPSWDEDENENEIGVEQKTTASAYDAIEGPFVNTVFAQTFLDPVQDSILNVVETLNETSTKSQKAKLSGTASPSKVSSLLHKLWNVIASHETRELDNSDFYFKPNFYEYGRCLSVINDILAEVSRLLETASDNATLSNILVACTELRSFSSNTTLARLIVKLEQILKFLDELIKYSSGTNKKTMNGFVDRITQLVVSWRQLELASFNKLFDNERKLIEKKLDESFYLLFELLVVGYANNEKQPEEVVSLLNLFMSNSSQGEYRGKLNLLKAFSRYMKTSFDKETELIDNIIMFYDQFLPIITKNIDNTRERLTKEINEVILLASWKDTNIDALHESSKKSRKSLYKVVRKYRAALTLSVHKMIDEGLPYELKSDENVSSGADVVSSCSIVDFTLNTKKWKQQSKLLTNLEGFIPKVRQVSNELQKEELPDLYEFCVSTLSEMDRLRKATPRELTEANKKVVSTLKTEKRVLLSSVVKELRNMGLKVQEVQQYKLTVTAILARAKSMLELHHIDDSLFFRILDLLPRLRNAVANCVEDVPRDDVFKGLAIAEHLTFSLFSLRNPLRNVLESKETLHKQVDIIAKIASFSATGAKLVKVSSEAKLREQKFVLVTKFLPKLLDFAVDTIDRSVKLGQLKLSTNELISVLNDIKRDFDTLYMDYSSSNNSAKPLLTEEKIALFDKFDQSLVDCKTALDNFGSKYKSLSFVSQLVSEWLEYEFNFAKSSAVVADENVADLDTTIDSVLDLSKSIIVAVQSVKKALSEEVSVDTERYFLNTQQKYVTYKSSLYTDQISSKFAKLIDLISHSEHNSTLVSMIRYFLPLYAEYYNFVAIVSQRFADNYLSVTKSTYILSTALYRLATEGFCSPEEPSDKDDEQTESGSGGGLGDGAASDAKTNDDLDEEDLDDDALTANKDDDERDDDKDDQADDREEDKAIDIEGDMEGKNEDMEAQDDENDNKDDKDDTENLDEEIDDLDELDPNAIDEKMWDEETEENNKEKDSENMPDNSKPDSDDLEAMEDDAKAGADNDNNEAANEEENEAEDKENDKEGDDETNEEDENADNEEDVGQQDDEVVQDDNEEFENNVPETEALQLPEDLNLDNEEDDGKEENDVDDEQMNMDDKMDEAIDLDNEEDNEKKQEEQEGENQQPEDDNNAEQDEEMQEDPLEGETQEQDKEEKDEGEGEEEEEEEPADVGEAEDDDKNKTDNTKDQGIDEADDEGVEGIDTEANNDENVDTEASAKQTSGEEREGADAANDNADNAGLSGALHQQQSDSTKHEQGDEEQKEQQENEKLKESLKQLGDSLNEFYKRSEDIIDSNEVTNEDQQDNNSAENPDQFQHLDDADEKDFKQALGNADQEQVEAIDEDMQIDEQDDDEQKDGEENDKKEGQENSAEQNTDADEDAEIQGDKQVAMDEELDTNKQDIEAKDSKTNEELEDKNSIEDEEFNLEGGLDENEDSEEEDDELMDELTAAEGPKIVDLEKETDFEVNPPPITFEDASKLWQESEFATNELSLLLCEQLRLILSPTVATKLKGDYKTGKRLNLKKIISYIASDFKKDKIWLKRTKPSKRSYQIMISIDDSKSMSENPETVKLTYNTISLVSKALTQLESGDLSIVKFGKDTSIIHNFNKKFDARSDGPKCFQWFGFDDTVTNMKDLVENSIEIFNRNTGAASNSDLYKLEIIISDGICESHEEIARLVRRAKEEKLLIVFVIIDGLNKNKESITDMSQVKYEMDESGNMNMKIDKYLDSFPFENYVIVNHIQELPELICQILRTFFMSSV